MQISFGNTFHLYSNSVHSTIMQDNFIEDLQQKRVVSTMVEFSDFNAVGGHNAYLKNVIMTGEDKEADKEIKRFCAYNNIDFKEFTQAELYDLDEIKKRVIIPPMKNGVEFFLELVDCEKLNSILQNQGNNFGQVEENWKKHSKKSKQTIESGCDILAPMIHVALVDDIDINYLKYKVEKFGVDSLDSGIISACLIQKNELKNNITYFELQKLGMKYIPVAVDKDTKEILSVLGVIKKD